MAPQQPQARTALVSAYGMRARALFGLDDPTKAQDDFRALLALDPSYALSGQISPRVVALFDKVKAAVVGSLALAVNPPDAQLEVNGQPSQLSPPAPFRSPPVSTPSRQRAWDTSPPRRRSAWSPAKRSSFRSPSIARRRSCSSSLCRRTWKWSWTGCRVAARWRGRWRRHTPVRPRSSALPPSSCHSRWCSAISTQGTHTVQYKKDCYVTEERKLPIEKPDDYQQDPAHLKPAVASIAFESTPAGAAVFVDGERRGTTPATLSDVCEGRADRGAARSRRAAGAAHRGEDGRDHAGAGRVEAGVCAAAGRIRAAGRRLRSPGRRGARPRRVATGDGVRAERPRGGRGAQGTADAARVAGVRCGTSAAGRRGSSQRGGTAGPLDQVCTGARRAGHRGDLAAVAELARPGGGVDCRRCRRAGRGGVSRPSARIRSTGRLRASITCRRCPAAGSACSRPTSSTSTGSWSCGWIPGAPGTRRGSSRGTSSRGPTAGQSPAARSCSSCSTPSRRAPRCRSRRTTRRARSRTVQVPVTESPRLMSVSDQGLLFNPISLALRSRLAAAAAGGSAVRSPEPCGGSHAAGRLCGRARAARSGAIAGWPRNLARHAAVSARASPTKGSGDAASAQRSFQDAAASGGLLTEDGPPVKGLAERKLAGLGVGVRARPHSEPEGCPGLHVRWLACYIRQVLSPLGNPI